MLTVLPSVVLMRWFWCFGLFFFLLLFDISAWVELQKKLFKELVIHGIFLMASAEFNFWASVDICGVDGGSTSLS